jgi:SAM-dependent methyltransferase
VLELGSLNVNGGLRSLAPIGAIWTGVDLEQGPGVDVIIDPSKPFPFPDKSFDLVIASSVFEHDPTFWNTFEEMVRLVSDEGFIYINAPSNGHVHRFPIDAFRFYPDAGMALANWGARKRIDLRLVESFISKQDEDIWNDFCAIFSTASITPSKLINSEISCSNIWAGDVFIDESIDTYTEDGRKIENLTQEISKLKSEIKVMQNSKSWRITGPLRTLSNYVFMKGRV